jgi:hypothetical protein
MAFLTPEIQEVSFQHFVAQWHSVKPKHVLNADCLHHVPQTYMLHSQFAEGVCPCQLPSIAIA